MLTRLYSMPYIMCGRLFVDSVRVVASFVSVLRRRLRIRSWLHLRLNILLISL